MINIKRILCPTDFSEASFKAVKTANDIAEHFSAQLTLLYVLHPPMPMPISDVDISHSFDVRFYEDRLLKSAEDQLADVVESLISKTIRTQSKAMCNINPAKTICDLAETENSDLIVLATHGMTGWRHYVQGSVAQKVVQNTRKPVLLVHGLPSDNDNELDQVAQASQAASIGNSGPLTLGVIP